MKIRTNLDNYLDKNQAKISQNLNNFKGILGEIQRIFETKFRCIQIKFRQNLDRIKTDFRQILDIFQTDFRQILDGFQTDFTIILVNFRCIQMKFRRLFR